MNKQELTEILALYLPYGVGFKKKTYPYTILDLEDITDINYIEKGKGKLLLNPLSIVDKKNRNFWRKVNIDIDLEDLIKIDELVRGERNWLSMSVENIQFLASQHIDFAGLIELGYAVKKEVGDE